MTCVAASSSVGIDPSLLSECTGICKATLGKNATGPIAAALTCKITSYEGVVLMRCKETEYRNVNVQSHVLSPQMYEDRLQEVSVYARGMVHERYIRDNANASRTNGGTTDRADNGTNGHALP
jgi:hypothetical protein